ncbi:ATP-binding protein [Candidatus Saccharibacteria bacterium]|nr:ATP-binding protein [Candidatus Saccharibacteria bacterium]
MKRKELLKTIIADNQSRPLPALWPRTQTIPIGTGKIITLTGVRRSGKTYHLYEIMRSLQATGIPADTMLYINFEDERLHLEGEDMDLILQAFRELHPEADLSNCYFFFDEIQEVAGWELFVDRLYETISRHIFITGSNSRLLSKEIATALRGRTLNFEVYPLSFSEFLSIKQPGLNMYQSADRARIVSHFDQFLAQGGFPAVTEQEDEDLRQKELQGYFDVMLLRDLVERYSVSSVAVLRYFCKRVIGASAGEFSVNRVYNELKGNGYKVGRDTLYAYQEHCEAIYMACFVPRYDNSVVKSENSLRKPYVIDHGLGAALNFKFGNDAGRILETVVALELIKQGKQIYYFQDTNNECDFVVVCRAGVEKVIQVSFDISDPATLRREVRGLVACCRRLGVTEGYILTHDTESVSEVDGIAVKILPVWKHCLVEAQHKQ